MLHGKLRLPHSGGSLNLLLGCIRQRHIFPFSTLPLETRFSRVFSLIITFFLFPLLFFLDYFFFLFSLKRIPHHPRAEHAHTDVLYTHTYTSYDIVKTVLAQRFTALSEGLIDFSFLQVKKALKDRQMDRYDREVEISECTDEEKETIRKRRQLK